jgi:hypothetical protein
MTYDQTLYLFKKKSISELKGELFQCGLEIDGFEDEEVGETCLRDVFSQQTISLTIDLEPIDIAEIEHAFEIEKGKILGGFCFESSHGEDAQKIDSFAKKLIDKFGGYLFDPQCDSITYPKVLERKNETQLRSRVLTLKWLVQDLGTSRSEEICKQILSANKASETQTKKALESIRSKKYCFLDWKIHYPCLRAEITVPCGVEALHSEIPFVAYTLDLDHRYFQRNQSEVSELRQLLVDGACTLKSFYAAAYVRDNIINENGKLEEDEHSDQVFFGRGNKWTGIPDYDMWLAWFGDDLKKKLPKNILEKLNKENGNLLQQGEHPSLPVDMSEFAIKFPDSLLNIEFFEPLRIGVDKK